MSNRFFPNHPTYKITSRFGMRTHPVSKVQKMHKGIDLVALHEDGYTTTDYITAHTGGTVCGVGYDDSAGNYIKIQVAEDVVMVYYHLRSASPCAKGQTVKQGDIIGYMGATGNVTGAHLHFGIKVGNEWIDPEPYLDKDYIQVTQPTKTISIELPVLKRGAKCEAVRGLQALLIGYGYSVGDKGIDGSFGPATDNAVESYQEDNDLTPDGSVGPATWASLLGV